MKESTGTLIGFSHEVVSPLIPAGYDIAFSIVPIVLVAVLIVGLVSIIRRYRAMSVLEAAGWSAVVVIAPVVGTVVWFLVGRKRYTSAQNQ